MVKAATGVQGQEALALPWDFHLLKFVLRAHSRAGCALPRPSSNRHGLRRHHKLAGGLQSRSPNDRFPEKEAWILASPSACHTSAPLPPPPSSQDLPSESGSLSIPAFLHPPPPSPCSLLWFHTLISQPRHELTWPALDVSWQLPTAISHVMCWRRRPRFWSTI